MKLTANVDLELTEVCHLSDRKLHDDVSIRLQVGATHQADCSSGCNGARVLTTESVVPQRRCSDGR